MGLVLGCVLPAISFYLKVSLPTLNPIVLFNSRLSFTLKEKQSTLRRVKLIWKTPFFFFANQVHELALQAAPILAVTGILVIYLVHNHIKFSFSHEKRKYHEFWWLLFWTLGLYIVIFGWNGSSSLGCDVGGKQDYLDFFHIFSFTCLNIFSFADFPYKYKRASWKLSNISELVWCMAVFLQF